MEQRDEKFKSLVLLGSILAVLGVCLSMYTIFHHLEVRELGKTTFACNISDTLSCDDIANSKYAEDPWGNPMGVYGIGYFLGLLALLVTSRTKHNLRKDALQAYTAMVGIGVIVSVSLFGISEFVIGKICPTCVGIYLVTFLQASILLYSRSAVPGPFNFKSVSNGGWYGIIALLATIAAFQIVKPTSMRNFKPDLPMTNEEINRFLEEKARSGNGGSNPSLALDKNINTSIKIDFTAYSGLGEDYRKGSDEAKVKIVEFADFQCPACSSAASLLKSLNQEMGDKVLVVFKNFPLDASCNTYVQTKMHQFACEAAVMARCAGLIGKFWPMNEKLFENQRNIDSTRLLAWAKDLGLNDDQIKQCKSSPDLIKKIQDDARQASEAGLTGTPTLYINGQRYTGPLEFDALRAVVQALL